MRKPKRNAGDAGRNEPRDGRAHVEPPLPPGMAAIKPPSRSVVYTDVGALSDDPQAIGDYSGWTRDELTDEVMRRGWYASDDVTISTLIGQLREDDHERQLALSGRPQNAYATSAALKRIANGLRDRAREDERAARLAPKAGRSASEIEGLRRNAAELRDAAFVLDTAAILRKLAGLPAGGSRSPEADPTTARPDPSENASPRTAWTAAYRPGQSVEVQLASAPQPRLWYRAVIETADSVGCIVDVATDGIGLRYVSDPKRMRVVPTEAERTTSVGGGLHVRPLGSAMPHGHVQAPHLNPKMRADEEEREVLFPGSTLAPAKADECRYRYADGSMCANPRPCPVKHVRERKPRRVR